ncbi:MAG: type II toxin-antitoxin system mRNA interferase toxin, RelE/StbE family [bacterium]
MIIRFHKNFEKQYKKFSSKKKNQIQKKLELFLNNPFNPILNNHPLKGKFLDYRSINITGDLRAVYKYSNGSEEECIFATIGSHSELYS